VKSKEVMAVGKLSTVCKILGLQLLVILIVSSGFYLTTHGLNALFSLLGGITAFLPNLYFALRISQTNGQEAHKIMRSFYAGESGKLLLTAFIFFIIFQVPNLKILPLMTTYVATLSVFWFALITLRN
jgi:ATP synthase protein I